MPVDFFKSIKLPVTNDALDSSVDKMDYISLVNGRMPMINNAFTAFSEDYGMDQDDFRLPMSNNDEVYRRDDFGKPIMPVTKDDKIRFPKSNDGNYTFPNGRNNFPIVFFDGESGNYVMPKETDGDVWFPIDDKGRLIPLVTADGRLAVLKDEDGKIYVPSGQKGQEYISAYKEATKLLVPFKSGKSQTSAVGRPRGGGGRNKNIKNFSSSNSNATASNNNSLTSSSHASKSQSHPYNRQYQNSMTSLAHKSMDAIKATLELSRMRQENPTCPKCGGNHFPRFCTK